jgi:hypothetical protein
LLSECDSKPPAEWTIKYWQWIYSKPKDKNPLKNGNIYCDDFIGLPCTGGGEDCGRKITLSGKDAEKDILIPVFASEYSTAEVKNAADEDLRSMAREMSRPVTMEVSLDSVPLIPYYVESKPFNLRVPSNHSLESTEAEAGTYSAVSCGYWHKLKPLPKGKHIIRFGGSGRNGFFTKVLYELSVT